MSRLIGIPSIISPELLYTLAQMGHGDEILFADSNYPSRSTCSKDGPRHVDASGHSIPQLLEAVLPFFPLDTHVFNPAIIMDLVNSDKAKNLDVSIWKEYEKMLGAGSGRNILLLKMDRFEFYERAKRAFAVVSTGETSLYGNIILKKGVIN